MMKASLQSLSKTFLFLFLITLTANLHEVKAQCASNQSELTLSIDFSSDFFPDEDGWILINTTDGIHVDSACFGTYGSATGVVTETICIDTGKTYSIYALDDYGDGLDGSSWTLSYTYGTTIGTMGSNNYNISYPFCGAAWSNNEIADSLGFAAAYFPAPACVPPTSPVVLSTMQTSATVSWTENGTATQWQIEYDTAGFTQGTGNLMVVSNDTVTLTGLMTSTSYDFYVRAICSPSDTSSWTSVASFSTACPSVVAPYSESFTTSIPNCWEQGLFNNENWVFSTSGGHVGNGGTVSGTTSSGGAFAYVDDSSPSSLATTLYTPFIDLSALSVPELSFYHISDNEGDSNVDFHVDIWDGSQWNDSVFFSDTNTLGAAWELITIDLSTLTISGDIRVRFVVDEVNGTDFDDDRAIDDFTVQEKPACPDPTSPMNMAITATTAQLSWVENGTATQWQIEYDTAGFTQGSGSFMIANSNPATISGLMAQTSYDWYVRAICGAGDTSAWLAGSSFLTSCLAPNPTTLPFVEDFESYSGTLVGDGIIKCDTAYNVNFMTSSQTDGRVRYGANSIVALSGSGSATLDEVSSNSPMNELILTVNLTNYSSNTDLEMLFDFMDHGDESSSGDSIWIRGSNADSWIGIYDMDPSSTSNGAINKVGPFDIDSILGAASQTVSSTFQMKFGQDDNSSATSATGIDGISFDDITIRQTPTCIAPSSLTANAFNSDSAELSWTQTGTAIEWEIEYGPTGFSFGNGTRLTLANNPDTLTGLTANTTYDWYIRAICAPGDTSAWSIAASFNTPVRGPQPLNCITGNPGIIFSEEFDAQGGWTGDIGTGSRQWQYNSGGTGSSSTGPSGAHSGSNYIYYEASSGTPTTASLVSPAIDLSNGNDYAELSFWFHAYGQSMATLDVGIGTSATGPFTTVFTNSAELQTSSADPWINVGINLDAYVGQTIYIEFFATQGSSFYGDMAIDLLELNTCLSCVDPLNLQAAIQSPNSVDVYWDDTNVSPTYEVSYGAPGLTPGSGTQFTTSSDSVNISGLMQGTAYEWFVRAICGPGDTSNWSGPASFNTPCNAPLPISLPFIEGWENYTGSQIGDASIVCDTNKIWDLVTGNQSLGRVQWGTNALLANNGAGAVTLDVSSNGTTVANDLILTLNLSNYTSATDLELLFDYAHHGEENNPNDSIWIRGSMSDPWVGIYDLYANQPATGVYMTVGALDIDSLLSDASQTVSSSFQVRIGQEDNFSAGSGDGYSFDDIVVRQTPQCLTPSALASTVLSSDSAILSWTENGTATQWEIEYGPSGFVQGNGTIVSTGNNPDTLTGLMAATGYDWYVRSICGADSSFWAGSSNFLTNCPPSYTAPYNENFDGASSTGNFNSAGVACWQAIGSIATDVDIVNSTDQAAPIPTTPYAVELNDGDWTNGDTAMLVSPAFSDLPTGLNRLRVQVAFESTSGASVDMYVGVLTDPNNSGTFVPLDTLDATDVGGTTNFGEVIINLDNTSLIGSSQHIGIAHGEGSFEAYVDSFVYEPIPPNNLAVTSVIRPNTKCGTANDSVEIRIANIGTAAQSNFSVGYSLNGVAITPETYTGSIAAGATANYTFSTTTNYSGTGTYDVTAYTMLGTDVDPTNDTASTTVVLLPSVSSFPYAESFETGAAGWAVEGNSSWELGAPNNTAIDTASDGTQAWVTDLDADYFSGEIGWVNSPCLDFSNVDDPYIEMDIWYEIEDSWDGAVLQSSIDGGATWQKVGDFGDTVNWYNDNTIDAFLGSIEPSGEGWTGVGATGSQGWITAEHYLDGLGGQSNVRLRVVFASDGFVTEEGFAFDNVRIYDNPIPAPYYPIGTINTVDANGVADSLGVEVRTSGTVVGVDLDGNNGLSFTIIDLSSNQQEGINIFNFNDVSNYVVNEGDSIMVWGDVDQFNGLQEIFVDSIMVIAQNRPLPAPIATNSLGENTESRLIQLIDDFVLLDNAGTGSYNMDATNGTDTITVRVDADTDVNDSINNLPNGLLIGDTICGLTGVGGQFDNSMPYTSGYQIFPMRYTDMTICKNIIGIEEDRSSTANLNIYPNPTTGMVTIEAGNLTTNDARIRVRDLSGKILFDDRLNSKSDFSKTIDFSDRANGIYFITIIDGENMIHEKLIKN